MERREDQKAKARHLERGGAHDSALQIYLRLAEAATPVPGCLRVQIGNLQRQLNQVDSAAESFSYAVSAFAEAGQLNNAIAANQLVIELAPDSADHHRRLGELSLLQGYREFARSGVSTYARLMSLAGNPAGAAESVASFLGRFPDDDRLWRGWIDDLRDGGSAGRAKEAMQSLHAALLGAGALDVARRVQTEIDARYPIHDAPSARGQFDDASRPRDSALAAGDDEELSDDLPFLQVGSSTSETDGIALLPGLELTSQDSRWSEDDADDGKVEPLQLLGAADDDPSDLLPAQVQAQLADWTPEAGPEDLPPQAASVYELSRPEGIELSDDDHSGEVDLESLFISGNDPYSAGPETAEESSFAGSWSPEAATLAPLEASLTSDDEGRSAVTGAEEGDPGPATIDVAFLVSALRELGPMAVEPADPATHFDLGVAYKEMGLWEESVAHLASAMERGHDPLAVLEVAGEILVESGDTELAHDLLGSVPGAGQEASPELAGIHYWMGRLAEADNPSVARRLFELVAAVMPDFMDVESRLRRLSQTAL